MAIDSQMPAPKADSQEILRFLQLICPAECVSEVRILDAVTAEHKRKHTLAGYFDYEHLREAASRIASIQNGRESFARGVYVTLNPVIPSLHARAYNRLKIAESGDLTKDTEIDYIRTLLLDFDPRRPGGISSSDSEHQLAHELAMSVKQALETIGFPLPVVLSSGNGWHLLFRLLLPNNGENCGLIQHLLHAISTHFSNGEVVIDSQVFNPSRITKIAGTIVCKGDRTPGRPWRVARLGQVPETWEVVPRGVLEKCLNNLSPREGFKTAYTPAQPPTFLAFSTAAARNGYKLVGPRKWKGRDLWTMPCPWRPDDGMSVYICERPSGFFGACWHRDCPGSRERGNHWQELQRMVRGKEELGDMSMDGESPENRAPEERRIACVSEIPPVWDLSADLRWLIDEIIALGSLSLICSESGTGKTWLAYFMAGCVAHGTSFLGRKVKKCPVLYLDGENPLFVVKQRLNDLSIASTRDLAVWGGWNDSPPPGPDSSVVVDFAKQGDCLIVYDSLVEFHSGSEQSATETRVFMRRLRRLANLGAAVLLLHNTGKSESSKVYRGSSDIKAAVDMAYLLERTSGDDGKLGELTLKCFKGRLAPGPKEQMGFSPGEGFRACAPSSKVGPLPVDIVRQILTAAPGRNQKQVVEAARPFGLAKHQVEDCLKNGLWHTEIGPHGAILYSVAEDLAEFVL